MTDKELRILDEMLANLEIWSTWNKTFANEMIGICSKMRNLLADRKTEPQTDTEIAKAIVHKMIDDAVIAEDAYPDLRQKMHDAVDEYEPQTERSE